MTASAVVISLLQIFLEGVLRRTRTGERTKADCELAAMRSDQQADRADEEPLRAVCGMV